MATTKPNGLKRLCSWFRQAWQPLWDWSYPFRLWEYRLAQRARRYLREVLSTSIITLCLTLLGLNAPATVPPFLQYWPWSLIPAFIFFSYCLRLYFLAPPESISPQKVGKKLVSAPLKRYLSILLHSVAFLTLIFSLVAIALVHTKPSWCPQILCPPPVPVSNAVFNDGTLAIALAHQPNAQFFVYLPPSRPTGSLSTAIGATQADGSFASNSYDVVLDVQNIRPQHIGLTIESVDLVVTQIRSLPSHPLKVWANTQQFVTQSLNLYVGQYSGQLAGGTIHTIYKRFAHDLGLMHLDPQERDQIEVQVFSQREVLLAFQIRITYRIVNSAILYPLLFPHQQSQSFQVAFATVDDWHLCSVEASRC